MAEICITHTHTRAVSLGPHRFFSFLLFAPASSAAPLFYFSNFVVKGNNKKK
jgi:hypothetical protein